MFFLLFFSLEANLCLRSSSFQSPFKQQRSCDFAQRCYRPVPAGNPMSSSPRSQPNAKLLYTIATQWNVSSCSSATLYLNPTFPLFHRKCGQHLRELSVFTRIGCCYDRFSSPVGTENRGDSEVGGILTAAYREFGGCIHRCAGKLKRREQDRASPRRRGRTRSGTAEG